MVRISVIIPVYNQYSSLCKVLNAFSIQTTNVNTYEVIVVDDGSSDEIRNISDLACFGKIRGRIIHQENRGRASARNAGIREAQGNVIIFCDADRFPRSDFIVQHMKFHQKGADIVIGTSFDYFGNINLVLNEKTDWDFVNRFSRLPPYFRKISTIFDESGQTISKLSWLGYLVGNSSIKKEIVNDVGGFDESFTEWGFEHFDAAYRLYRKGYRFTMNRSAVNYHIPHPRQKYFYKFAITSNAEMFANKYPEIDARVLAEFINGRTENEIAEKTMFKEKRNEKR
mgnify:CR=1 FL=1